MTVIHAGDGKTVLGFGKTIRQVLITDEAAKPVASMEATARWSFQAAVLESVEDGIVACDAQGNLTIFNRATREFHGLPEAPLSPDQWASHYDLYGPDGKTHLAMEEVPLFRALKGEIVRNAEMVIAPIVVKRRTILASGRPMVDVDGQILGAVISMHDISAEREAQRAKEQAIIEQARRFEAEQQAEQLRVSSERFRVLVMASSQVVWVTEADRSVTEDSPTWRAFSGQTWEQYRGHGWNDVVHPEDREKALELWQEALVSKSVYQNEYRIWHAAGMYRWVSVRAVPLLEADASIREWIGTNTDITERREAEICLQDAEERLRLATDAAELGIWMWEVEADKAT